MQPFSLIRNHVLLPVASALQEADMQLRPRLTKDIIEDIVNTIPEDWLTGDPNAGSLAQQRAVYANFLITRIENSDTFVKEAIHARQSLV